MDRARDILEPAATVPPTTTLPDLARDLLELDTEAVCVIEGDRLVGVVTGMDLVYREKRVQLPVPIVVLDLVFQLGARRAEREIEKISAVTVGELMTRDVVTVGPDTPVDEIAAKMVEQHLSMVPVLDDGRLVGVVTRRAMVELALRHLVGPGDAG